MIAKPFAFNLLTEKDAGTKWFDKLEVVFVLEGPGRVLLDSYYNLNKTDIFVVNGFQPRDIIFAKDAIALALYIDCEFVSNSSPEVFCPYFDCKSFFFY